MPSDLAPFTAAHDLYGEIWSAFDARRRSFLSGTGRVEAPDDLSL